MIRNFFLLVIMLAALTTNTTTASNTDAYTKSKIKQTELGIKSGFKGVFCMNYGSRVANSQSFSTTGYPFGIFFDQKLFLNNTSLGIEILSIGYHIRIGYDLQRHNEQILEYSISGLNIAMPFSWWFLGYEKGINLALSPHLFFIENVRLNKNFSNKILNSRNNDSDIIYFDQFNIGVSLRIKYLIMNMFSVSASFDYFAPNIKKQTFHLTGINFLIGLDFLSLYTAIFSKED